MKQPSGVCGVEGEKPEGLSCPILGGPGCRKGLLARSATLGSRLLRLRQLARNGLDHVLDAQHVLVGQESGELACVLLGEAPAY